MNSKIHDLNNDMRAKMKQIIHDEISMEWDDASFFDEMLGKLPQIRTTERDKEVIDEIRELHFIYDKYDAIKTNKSEFVYSIERIVNRIRDKIPNWFGLNLISLREIVNSHSFCLISGMGGIGKSYFLWKLEHELEEQGISHLCLYGKFEKDIKRIPEGDIINEALKSGFVFIFDAVNEMSYSGQTELLNLVSRLRKCSGIRIILSYRTNALNNQLVEKYKRIASMTYTFPGVSFESAMEELIRQGVPDLFKYEDILYSQNANFA